MTLVTENEAIFFKNIVFSNLYLKTERRNVMRNVARRLGLSVGALAIVILAPACKDDAFYQNYMDFVGVYDFTGIDNITPPSVITEDQYYRQEVIEATLDVSGCQRDESQEGVVCNFTKTAVIRTVEIATGTVMNSETVVITGTMLLLRAGGIRVFSGGQTIATVGTWGWRDGINSGPTQLTIDFDGNSWFFTRR